MSILSTAEMIFKKCFALKPEQSVLIVTDDLQKDLANIFHDKAIDLGNDIAALKAVVEMIKTRRKAAKATI